MTEAEEPGHNPEIQEKHSLEQKAKNTGVSGETEADIETEIKVDFHLETVTWWVVFRNV